MHEQIFYIPLIARSYHICDVLRYLNPELHTCLCEKKMKIKRVWEKDREGVSKRKRERDREGGSGMRKTESVRESER